MKLWIDDVRPAPEGSNSDWIWCKSVNEAKRLISVLRYQMFIDIDVIDIDHDAGEYAQYGGDYIKLLEWLEWAGLSYPIHIHSMNPVGVQNMRAIIQHNGWEEV